MYHNVNASSHTLWPIDQKAFGGAWYSGKHCRTCFQTVANKCLHIQSVTVAFAVKYISSFLFRGRVLKTCKAANCSISVYYISPFPISTKRKISPVLLKSFRTCKRNSNTVCRVRTISSFLYLSCSLWNLESSVLSSPLQGTIWRIQGNWWSAHLGLTPDKYCWLQFLRVIYWICRTVGHRLALIQVEWH